MNTLVLNEESDGSRHFGIVSARDTAVDHAPGFLDRSQWLQPRQRAGEGRRKVLRLNGKENDP